MPYTFTQNKNYAKSTLGGNITDVATSLSVAGGGGASFPAVTSSVPGNFTCVIWGASYASPYSDTSREIITVTNRSTDTFTIVRAVEGTTNKAWSTGDNIALVLTAGKLDELETAIDTCYPICTPLAWQNSVNLKAVYTSATQVTVTADEMLLQNESDYSSKRFATVSEVIAITTSGASGLDTGAEANSTWYHIWIIAKADGTINGLFSVSATAPTMPANYVYKSYVGAVYNNSSGNFNAFKQTGNLVTSDNNVGGALIGGTSATWASLSLSAIIPTTASSVTLWLQADIASGTSCACYCSGVTGGGTGYVGALVTGATGTLKTISTAEIPISTAQTIYYYKAGDSATIYVTGWRY